MAHTATQVAQVAKPVIARANTYGCITILICIIKNPWYVIVKMIVFSLPPAAATGFFSQPAALTGCRPISLQHRKADIAHMACGIDLLVTEAVRDVDRFVVILADVAVIKLLGSTT